MNLNPRTRCPYTLKALNELATVSDEHVIPDSLGCPRAYSVRADTATNSMLGSSVDANLVGDFLVSGLRHQHGVRSRSGQACWKMEGTTEDGEHPVEVTLPYQAPAKIYYKKPFILSEDGSNAVIVSGADWTKRTEELRNNLARKGKKLEVRAREELPSTVVKVQAQMDLTHQKVGLMKIAYLAAFEYLGDPFLDDPLNQEWQKFIRATELSQIEELKIRGVCFTERDILGELIPALEPHQHATVVIKMRDVGPLVGVRLFGDRTLSVLCRASETQDFGLGETEGKVVVCDSKQKTITVMSAKEVFLKKCGIIPTAANA